jgi:phenylacetate-CoA ligase
MLPALPEALVRNVVYPVYRGFRRDRVLDMLDELEYNQFLPERELEDLRWRRLLFLLEAAEKYVPYYRDLFEREGIATASLDSPADMARVPLLTREIIGAEKDRLVTTDPVRKGYTVGSGASGSGRPDFWCDRAAEPVRKAAALRGYRWTGFNIGGRQALLWGPDRGRWFGDRIGGRVKNYLSNILVFPAEEMTPEKMKRYWRRLRRFRPSLVLGYPSALETLSRFCSDEGLSLPAVKGVLVGGESLQEEQRVAIRKAFRAEVMGRYGRKEFSVAAQECPEHGGMHIFSDLFHIEVIGESGQAAGEGESGEIVITDLTNHYMPLIRYRTGDLAVVSSRRCECGRTLPLLERVESYSTVCDKGNGEDGSIIQVVRQAKEA